MLSHRTRSTVLAATLSALTLALTGTSAAALAATDEPPAASRATPPTTLTVKDDKDPKALYDLRQVDVLGLNEEIGASITYKANEYGQDFPELVDFAVWFNTDDDNTPEYRMRGADDSVVYAVKNWKPFGGTIVKNCSGYSAAFSATNREFDIPVSCLNKNVDTFKVHVSTFFTGDQPYPEGTDHVPNKAKGWTKAVSID